MQMQQCEDTLQHAGSVIVRLGRDGKIRYFNEYAQRLFGYREEEVLGKPVQILLPPDQPLSDEALVEDFLSHPERHAVDAHNENILRDGTRVRLLWSNSPIYDDKGEIVELVCIGTRIPDYVHVD